MLSPADKKVELLLISLVVWGINNGLMSVKCKLIDLCFMGCFTWGAGDRKL
jgi:hypothetical protein